MSRVTSAEMIRTNEHVTMLVLRDLIAATRGVSGDPRNQAVSMANANDRSQGAQDSDHPLNASFTPGLSFQRARPNVGATIGARPSSSIGIRGITIVLKVKGNRVEDIRSLPARTVVRCRGSGLVATELSDPIVPKVAMAECGDYVERTATEGGMSVEVRLPTRNIE